MPKRKLSFEQACARYVHRYTMEHVPQWAKDDACERGELPGYYAPQFRSDCEWYEHTKFAGESALADSKHCYTSGQTWPLGHWLDKPYSI